MTNIKILLILIFIISSTSMYSQKLSNSVKNEMVEFLIKEKQYTNDDLEALLKDIKTEKGVVFWQKEVPLECKIGINLFYFGSSSSHSKTYVALIKDNKESLFLGTDLKEEGNLNLIFNFIRFFDEDTIICFYEKIFPLIIKNVYKDNCQLPSNAIRFFK